MYKSALPYPAWEKRCKRRWFSCDPQDLRNKSFAEPCKDWWSHGCSWTSWSYKCYEISASGEWREQKCGLSLVSTRNLMEGGLAWRSMDISSKAGLHRILKCFYRKKGCWFYIRKQWMETETLWYFLYGEISYGATSKQRSCNEMENVTWWGNSRRVLLQNIRNTAACIIPGFIRHRSLYPIWLL